MRPRFVQEKGSANPPFGLVHLALAGFQFWNMWNRHPDKRGETLWILAGFVGFSGIILLLAKRWVLKSKADKIELLRNGIPHRAIVEEVSETPSFVDGSNRLTYWYQNQYGHAIRETTKIQQGTIDGHPIAPGDTFTLLISPTDPENMMPYFTAKQFNIIPIVATSVSQNVSSRIALNKIQTAVQPMNQLGCIEPELLGASPRRVSLSAENIRFQFWMVAFLSFFASIVAIFWKIISNQTSYMITAGVFGFFLISITHSTWQHMFKSYFLLRSGVATRGVITEGTITSASENFPPPDQVLAFLYEFEGPEGGKRSSTFCIKRSRATQLHLQEGSRFTVLYNPKKPTNNAPYFDIYGAEVVGRTRANITQA